MSEVDSTQVTPSSMEEGVGAKTVDVVVCPPPPTPADVVALMLRTLEPTTLAAYHYSLKRYAEWCRQPSNLAAAELLSLPAGTAMMRLHEYRASFTRIKKDPSAAGTPRPLAPATINARFAGIRALVAFARGAGVVTWEVAVRMEKVTTYKDTRGPGADVIAKLFVKLEADTSPRGRRDFAMARVLYDLALRRESVVSLDLSHYEPAEAVLWIKVKGKGDRVKKEMPAATAAALEQWLEVRRREAGALFPGFTPRAGKITGVRLSGNGFYYAVTGWGDSIGVKLHPHGFRHTALTVATNAAPLNGMGLGDVLKFSDHASISTLTHYIDATNGAQKRISELVSGNPIKQPPSGKIDTSSA